MQRHAAAAAAAWCFIILVFPVYGCFCLLKSTARQGKSRPGRYVFFFHHTHSLPVWVLIGCSSPFSLSLLLSCCTPLCMPSPFAFFSSVHLSPSVFLIVYSLLFHPTISVTLSVFPLSFFLHRHCVCVRSWHGWHASIWKCSGDDIEHM